jgi:hypothetical protein
MQYSPCAVLHALPQPPQFNESVSVETQAAPQAVSVQMLTHSPA